jgi:hypothetical protein
MRETRPYGSEGGESGINRTPLPLYGTGLRVAAGLASKSGWHSIGPSIGPRASTGGGSAFDRVGNDARRALRGSAF